jgi:hypothetical protein
MSVVPPKAEIDQRFSHVGSGPILLQKSLAIVLNDDSIALMRFAAEAINDGAAQSRPR